MTGAGSALFPCANPLPVTTLNQITVQVDCSFTPTLTTSGYWQRNVVFTAYCPTAQAECPSAGANPPIIRGASELRVAFRDRPHADRRQGHDDPVVERRPVNDRRAEDGLTLIELVISIVLMTMIAGALGAAFLTAATSSRQTAGRVRGSNDAQVVAAFLTRDAQSAGGVDPTTGLTDQSLGVFTNNLPGGNPCRASTNPVVRFRWVDRSAPVHTYDAVYAISGTTLVRIFCVDGAAPRPRRWPTTSRRPSRSCTVGGASGPCDDGTAGATTPLPDSVSITITETNTQNAPTPYTYTLSATVRPQPQQALSTSNAAAVPLLALGEGNCTGSAQATGLDLGGNANFDRVRRRCDQGHH